MNRTFLLRLMKNLLNVSNNGLKVMKHSVSKTGRPYLLKHFIASQHSQVFRTWCVTHAQHEEVAEEGHSEISQSHRLKTDMSGVTLSNAMYKDHIKAYGLLFQVIIVLVVRWRSAGRRQWQGASTRWHIVAENGKNKRKKDIKKRLLKVAILAQIIDTKLQKWRPLFEVFCLWVFGS